MRRLVLLLALLVVLPAAPASAQRSPADCTASGIALVSSWSPAKGRIGLPSTLSVRVTQPGAPACDVSGMTVRVALPGADGQPSATPTTLADARAFPFNMAPVTLSAAPWTVALNPGVAGATARVTWSGTVLDGGGGTATGEQLVPMPIVAPKLGFTVVADPATGTAPSDVTYRFTLTNLGAPPEPLGSVALAHPYCTPVLVSGDDNNDKELDAAETWRYACTHRFEAPGEYTSVSNASAISASDGRGVDATTVNTVVKVNPPAAPLGRLSLTTAASPASGLAPLTVAYTNTVRNDGTGAVKDVTVAVAGCGPVTTTGGAAPLAAGATRVFTCSRVFDSLGTFKVGSVASGIDVATGLLVSTDQTSTDVTTTAAPSATPAATATPQSEESTPPAPTPTPTPTPRSTVQPSARVTFTASGRFARPCRGKIALTLKAGTKTIARKSARPTRTCRYRVRFDVARSRLGKATRVTVTARLGKATRTQRLAVPR